MTGTHEGWRNFLKGAIGSQESWSIRILGTSYETREGAPGAERSTDRQDLDSEEAVFETVDTLIRGRVADGWIHQTALMASASVFAGWRDFERIENGLRHYWCISLDDSACDLHRCSDLDDGRRWWRDFTSPADALSWAEHSVAAKLRQGWRERPTSLTAGPFPPLRETARRCRFTWTPEHRLAAEKALETLERRHARKLPEPFVNWTLAGATDERNRRELLDLDVEWTRPDQLADEDAAFRSARPDRVFELGVVPFARDAAGGRYCFDLRATTEADPTPVLHVDESSASVLDAPDLLTWCHVRLVEATTSLQDWEAACRMQTRLWSWARELTQLGVPRLSESLDELAGAPTLRHPARTDFFLLTKKAVDTVVTRALGHDPGRGRPVEWHRPLEA
ncbi:MAG: SMI1/KNR4 family protein [Acidobacteriota bacterium]